jgi:glycosyltransferase involved in cell wall biosynthesis
MSTRKVFINAVSAKSGGAATYLGNLAHEFGQYSGNVDYTFLVPHDQLPSLPVGSKVRFLGAHGCSSSALRRLFFDQCTLRRALGREKIDLYLSHSDFGILFPPCRQIVMVRNGLFFSPFYVKTILPSKSKRFRLDFLLRRWLVCRSIMHADVVIVASESMLADVRRHVPNIERKAVVNYFGVPLDKFFPSSQPSRVPFPSGADTPVQMLYVSEYSDYKNLTTLLKAVLLLKQKGVNGFSLSTTADPSQSPHVEFTTRETDRALAAHPLVASAVHFTGAVPYDGIDALYRNSDIFVFPSLVESFGHPLIEAMASGLAVLASNIPICREICGPAAIYFEPLDPGDLAAKAQMLLTTASMRAQLGAIGRKRAETRFDWKDHVRRLLQIVENLGPPA